MARGCGGRGAPAKEQAEPATTVAISLAYVEGSSVSRRIATVGSVPAGNARGSPSASSGEHDAGVFAK